MIGGRPWLETLLIVMGVGGIVLSCLVGLLMMSTGLFMTEDNGGTFVIGLFLAIIGVTAGVCLIALSKILSYLRAMATGSGLGKVFE